MPVWYEWGIEIIGREGDIIDSTFEKRLKDLSPIRSAINECLVLVYNSGNEEDGVRARYWAYVKNDRLPNDFEDGPPVPERFHKELASYLKIPLDTASGGRRLPGERNLHG